MFSHRAHEIHALPPIAVIWGDRDRVIPAKHAEALAALVDGIQATVLKGCGHHLHVEQPPLFARVVREFFDAPNASVAWLRRKADAVSVESGSRLAA